MKTILASVYSLNPYKGSEEGMGWNYVYQAAVSQRVIAVTRKNNREAIMRYMQEFPDPVYANMQFLYFDLPYWARFWKRKGNGVILYYLLWQWFLPRFVKAQQLQFDIVHNMNFHNDWAPSFLWKLSKPFIWGPIGHHPRIPAPFLAAYGWKYRVQEQLTWIVKQFFWKCVPALKTTIKKADYIWCMNDAVPEVINLSAKRYRVSPSVATHDFGWNATRNNEAFTLITAGRLVPLKGFDLTISAFATFVQALPYTQRSKCVLYVVGKGPEQQYLQRLAMASGAAEYIVFIDWVERSRLMEMMKEATAFVFPSHEGAGMVVPEALSFGLPVLCIDNEGPGAFIDKTCGIAVPGESPVQTTKALSQAMHTLYNNTELRKELSAGARKRFEDVFSWEVRGKQLKQLYEQLA